MKEQFKEGLVTNNPVLFQLIGLCSTLAVSRSVMNALGMTISFIIVLTLSNLVISLLRNFIPDEIRIPGFIVVIASFVTIMEMVLHAYVPVLYESLGIFLPLIVVNCIILGRAEAFASKHAPFASVIDGLANGLGYGFALITLAVVRELLGAGTLFDIRIIPEEWVIPFLQQAPSAFMLLGTFIAVMSYIKSRGEEKAKAAQNAEAPLGDEALAEAGKAN